MPDFKLHYTANSNKSRNRCVDKWEGPRYKLTHLQHPIFEKNNNTQRRTQPLQQMVLATGYLYVEE